MKRVPWSEQRYSINEMYLIPVRCYLKKLTMVNTMLDAFYHKYEVNFTLHGNNDFLVELLLVEQLQDSFRKQTFLHWTSEPTVL